MSIVSDATERPWPFSQRPPNLTISLRLTIQAAKLQRQIDSTIVELELTRSKLREERQNAARMHGDLAAAKEAGYKLEANVQEAERRQTELKLQSAPLCLAMLDPSSTRRLPCRALPAQAILPFTRVRTP